MIEKLKLISVADLFSSCNATAGCLAIFFLIYVYPDLTIGTGMIFLALIFDGLDGLTARKFGVKHSYGHYIDSIADTISFCCAPALMLYIQYTKIYVADLMYLFVIITALCVASFGVARLVKFTRSGYKLKQFSGLPTPAMAIFILMVCHVLYPVHETIYVSIIAVSIILICSGLMLANIEYPKIRGKLGLIFILAFAVSMAVVTLQKLYIGVEHPFIFISYRVLSLGGLVILATYTFGTPLYYKLKNLCIFKLT